MRAHFQEHAVAQRLDGFFELHGLTEVLVPVFRVEGRCVRHCGAERDLRLTWRDLAQRRQQLVPHGLHLYRMRRIVDCDPLAGNGQQKFVDCVGISGYHHRSRAVHDRDRQSVVQYVVFWKRYRGHRSSAGEPVGDHPAPGDHNSCAVLKGQCARDAGCGDLALRMAYHRIGFDSE